MRRQRSRLGRLAAVATVMAAVFVTAEAVALGAPLLGFGPLDTYDFVDPLYNSPSSIVVDHFSLSTTHRDYPDAVVPNGQTKDRLTIFTNNGDGTYGAGHEVAVYGLDFGDAGTGFPAAVSADVSYPSVVSGFPDLLVCNQGSNSVAVLVGDGLGGFTPSATPTVPVGANPLSIAVADFNKDDAFDFVTANLDGDSLSVRLGNGDNTFSNPTTPTIVLPAGTGPTAVVTGDFDMDGNPDIACTDTSLGSDGDSVHVFLGDGTGGFTEATGSPFHVYPGAIPYGLSTGDFDGDGKTDLITTNSGAVTDAEALTVLTNTGGGSFNTTEAVSSGNPDGLGPLGVATAPLQSQPPLHSPYYDVVSPSMYIPVLKNEQVGLPEFSTVSTGTGTIQTPLISVALGDANNDGFLDIFTAGDNQLGVIMTDNRAPETSATGTPTGWNTTWINSSATVTLTATDVGLGVRQTYYGRSGATTSAVTAYTVPVTVTAEGTTTLSYFSVDNTGLQEETKTATIRIDETSPTVGITGIPVAPTTNPVTFTVTATDALSGVADRFYTLDGSSATTFTSAVSTSAVGSHTVHYWATDNAGNVSSHETTTFEIVRAIDTSITGVSAPWVNSNVVFSLTATGGVAPLTRYYQLSGAATSAVTAYSVPVTVTAEGTTTVSYYSVDSAANREATKTATIRIDETSPTVGITGIPVAPTTNPVTFTVTATDALSGVADRFYTLDGSSATTFTSAVSTSAVGSHTVHYWATDNAGNVSSHETTTFEIVRAIDTSITGVSAPWVNSNVVFSLTATGGVAPLTRYYQLSGAATSAVTAYSVPVTVTAEGTTTVSYYSVDSAANREATKTATIRIDETSPTVGITGIPVAPTTNPVTFTVTATDALSGVADRFYTLDGSSATTFTSAVSTSAVGSHTVHYWATDNAGNVSSHETTTFEIVRAIDTSITGVSAPWVNSNVVFSLTATGGVAPLTRYYQLSGAATSAVTAYSVPVTVTAEGTTTVSYYSVDSAANREATKTATIRIDTIDPVTSSNAQASYTGTATVSLFPTDTLSGVAHTFYKLDAGAVTTYTAPIVVDTPGSHALQFYSVDVAGNVETTQSAPAFTVDAAQVDVAGGDRYDTAVVASRSSFATGSVGTVVIATGEDFPDALSAAALAGAYRGPVLLTRRYALPASVATEIVRLGATRAVIVGGSGVVDGSVAEELVTGLHLGVSRLAGSTRYGTAASVAHAIKLIQGPALDKTIFIATGLSFPDALAGGPDAWAKVRPILLVNGATVPGDTLAAIADLGATRAVVLGGTGAVPASAATTVKNALSAPKTLVRLGGGTRYGTAQLVAQWSAAGEGLAWDNVGIATGTGFADALGGGPAMGAVGGVMMLTAPTVASPETIAGLSANKMTVMQVRFFGGTGAISDPVRADLMNALK